MRLQFAVLAESAAYSDDGKITAFGLGLKRYQTRQLPATWSFTVVSSIVNESENPTGASVEMYQYELDVLDPRGKSVLHGPIVKSMPTISREYITAVPKPYEIVNLLAPLHAVHFATPGEHSVKLKLRRIQQPYRAEIVDVQTSLLVELNEYEPNLIARLIDSHQLTESEAERLHAIAAAYENDEKELDYELESIMASRRLDTTPRLTRQEIDLAKQAIRSGQVKFVPQDMD
jgi:hypothetical protein